MALAGPPSPRGLCHGLHPIDIAPSKTFFGRFIRKKLGARFGSLSRQTPRTFMRWTRWCAYLWLLLPGTRYSPDTQTRIWVWEWIQTQFSSKPL